MIDSKYLVLGKLVNSYKTLCDFDHVSFTANLSAVKKHIEAAINLFNNEEDFEAETEEVYRLLKSLEPKIAPLYLIDTAGLLAVMAHRDASKEVFVG